MHRPISIIPMVKFLEHNQVIPWQCSHDPQPIFIWFKLCLWFRISFYQSEGNNHFKNIPHEAINCLFFFLLFNFGVFLIFDIDNFLGKRENMGNLEYYLLKPLEFTDEWVSFFASLLWEIEQFGFHLQLV